MSIIGDVVSIFASVAAAIPGGNTICDSVGDLLGQSIDQQLSSTGAPAFHQVAPGSQPSGPTAPITQHLSNFVATNGLHSIARQ